MLGSDAQTSSSAFVFGTPRLAYVPLSVMALLAVPVLVKVVVDSFGNPWRPDCPSASRWAFCGWPVAVPCGEPQTPCGSGTCCATTGSPGAESLRSRRATA